MSTLTIAGREFDSRLIIGTGGFRNLDDLERAVTESGAELATLALRRVDPSARGSLVDVLERCGVDLLPNTAGCFTARDAVTTAKLAREAFETDWVKLEVIGERETLYPDVEQLLQAAGELVRAGFVVLPYCNDDLVTCLKLADLGCAAVMPLGAPIGSGLGICNPAMIELICARSSVPVVLDAGIEVESVAPADEDVHSVYQYLVGPEGGAS